MKFFEKILLALLGVVIGLIAIRIWQATGVADDVQWIADFLKGVDVEIINYE